MSGYARIHRTLLGHPAFRNDAEAMAFAWMVLRAQWRETRVRYKDRMFNLRRGQLAASVRDIAAAMDRDKAWVERLLTRLRREAMIETLCEKGVNVITICNYEEYQASRDTDETKRETSGETGARQGRDTEQVREKGKEESKPAPKRVPRPDYVIPDFIPAEPWAAYDAMRKRKKAPMDGYIAEKQFKKLAQFAAAGWDIAKILDKATVNNWTDLFEPTLGRDDAMRANRAANDGKPVVVTDQAAYLANLEAQPWARSTPRAEQPPPERVGKPVTFASVVAQAGGRH